MHYCGDVWPTNTKTECLHPRIKVNTGIIIIRTNEKNESGSWDLYSFVSNTSNTKVCIQFDVTAYRSIWLIRKRYLIYLFSFRQTFNIPPFCFLMSIAHWETVYFRLVLFTQLTMLHTYFPEEKNVMKYQYPLSNSVTYCPIFRARLIWKKSVLNNKVFSFASK